MAQMLIGGEWVNSRSGDYVEVMNPATGEAVDRAPRGTKEDASEAIDAAEAAFATWSEWTQAKRADVLRRTVELIRANEKELATLLTKEQGKPLREAILEIRRYAHTIEYYAGLGKNIRGGYIPQIDDGKYGLIIKRPLGVCRRNRAVEFSSLSDGKQNRPGAAGGQYDGDQACRDNAAHRPARHWIIPRSRFACGRAQHGYGARLCCRRRDCHESQSPKDRLYGFNRSRPSRDGVCRERNQARDA